MRPARLLIKFPKRDVDGFVSRDTLRRLAQHHNLTQAAVVHLALARLASAELPGFMTRDRQASLVDMVERFDPAKHG